MEYTDIALLSILETVGWVLGAVLKEYVASSGVLVASEVSEEACFFVVEIIFAPIVWVTSVQVWSSQKVTIFVVVVW